jgi:hypothetical protein
MVFDSLATLTAVLLTARDGDRAQLATTITRMAVFFAPAKPALPPSVVVGCGCRAPTDGFTARLSELLPVYVGCKQWF